jgi:hypothetical protein
MNLEDRAAITDLIALHGHYVDAGWHDRMSELLTDDVTYDMTGLGGGVITGLRTLREAADAMGDRNPVGHHVTNIVVTEVDGDRASAVSKGIGIMADGSCGSVTYHDTLARTGDGWRITHRRLFKPTG